ncbi:MAG: hypothetical protein EXQ69_07585 [Acidimicrobiia bacterium]|nr:hypothetical protein [Acidimicrobiia bacterium]
MPVPLDELPVHQVPLSMEHMLSSDRNAYDRYYFCAHDRTGDVFLITGLGVYPNLGVIDAFATVGVHDKQHAVRISDALGKDRSIPSVGPYRIEVVESLQRLRLVCDTPEHGVAFDLTFEGSFPAADEVRHVWRRNGRIALDAQRFAQVGTWSGTLNVAGTDMAVDPEVWVGTRDRSWGIRPVGEAEPPGRAGDEPIEGFFWTYIPMRFDDFALLVIIQEDPDGTRVLNDAIRVFPASSGRPPEQLGWPEIEMHYRSGTRIPEGATLHLQQRGHKELVVQVDSLGHVALNSGPGYGGDPTWTHGEWRGRGWVDSEVYDMSDPSVAAMVPFGVVDHVGRATCEGQVGWGLFEHASFGRHDPTGFKDFTSVAP